MESQKTLSINEASKLLGLSSRWIAVLLRRGTLQGVRIHDRGRWRIPASSVERYLQSAG